MMSPDTLIQFGLFWLVACSAGGARQLPTEHAYQKTLRDYLASLAPEDFRLDVKPFGLSGHELPDWEKYRLTLCHQEYGRPDLSAVTAPAQWFTLRAIESPGGVIKPVVRARTAAWLTGWDWPGNPYRGLRPLKRRVFAVLAVDLVMHDELHEHGDGSANRSDYLGGTLIWLAHDYGQVRDALPAEVRRAYEAGLGKLVLRLRDWGPNGSMTDMDLFAPVSMAYAARILRDAEVSRVAEEYSRVLFTDPRYFHPAGYFVDNGCFDVSYNGISLYFAAWAAALTDWDFADRAVDKAFRLRGHLSVPDPDGTWWGPSHMSSRTSADAPNDQWGWNVRQVLAARSTDAALPFVSIPDRARLDRAEARLIGQLNGQLDAEPRAPRPWKESHWTSLPNTMFAGVTKAEFDRLVSLQATSSPLLRSPFQQPGDFVRNFGDALVVAKLGPFGAIIHTGPVGDGHRAWKRPYGFGGGALSAFWTRETGSVVLGRRRGIQGPVWDRYDEWRAWPTHAVSGVTKAGGVFSSARIRRPEVQIQTGAASATVLAGGTIPASNLRQGRVLDGDLAYRRRFELSRNGLRVETTVTGDGADTISELYETIPFFLRDARRQGGAEPTRIEFRARNNWSEATSELRSGVTAVRAHRFGGSVMIQFEQPVRAKLSQEDWTDGFQSQATCRNVLIDLAAGHPNGEWTRKVSWSIRGEAVCR